MPDSPIEPPPAGDYPSDMEARVAVLEQIARTTVSALDRIERRLDQMEANHRADLGQVVTATTGSFERIDRRLDLFERRLDLIDAHHRADFRWLLGIMLGGFAGLLGVVAHGFDWL